MIFKRRDKLSLIKRLKLYLYPKKGWRRAVEYLGHRVRRLPDSPHRIALGTAIGVFVCFTPLFGFHILAALLVAFILRGNLLAAFVATWVGNPLTFPFIAPLSLEFDHFVLGHNVSETTFQSVKRSFSDAITGTWQTTKSFFGYGDSAWDRLLDFIIAVFVPYLVGGLFVGAFFGAITYIITKPAVAAYQHRRAEKRKERMDLQQAIAKEDATQQSDADKNDQPR